MEGLDQLGEYSKKLLTKWILKETVKLIKEGENEVTSFEEIHDFFFAPGFHIDGVQFEAEVIKKHRYNGICRIHFPEYPDDWFIEIEFSEPKHEYKKCIHCKVGFADIAARLFQAGAYSPDKITFTTGGLLTLIQKFPDIILRTTAKIPHYAKLQATTGKKTEEDAIAKVARIDSARTTLNSIAWKIGIPYCLYEEDKRFHLCLYATGKNEVEFIFQIQKNKLELVLPGLPALISKHLKLHEEQPNVHVRMDNDFRFRPWIVPR
jgi:hypothetical protein